MYMEVLEQEVEALSAEVTRLRLMVHRITQVMGAPPAAAQTHVDPTRSLLPASHATTTATAAGDLQATVDSYKQLLPLIQLLLEQQQQQQQKQRGGSAHSRAGASRHHRHCHRTRRSPPTTASSSSHSSSASASSAFESASRSDARRSSPASHPSASDAVAAAAAAAAVHSSRTLPPQLHTAQSRKDAHKSAGRSSPPQPTTVVPAAASTSADKNTRSPAAAQRSRPLATASHSASVVDRLRAQRGLTARDGVEEKSSTSNNSSDVLPVFPSHRPAVTAASGSLSAQRGYPISGITRGGGGGAPTTKATQPDVLVDMPTHIKSSQSLLSSKLLDEPRAAEQSSSRQRVESLRSASLAAEDMGYYEFSPVVSVLDMAPEGSEAPQQSQNGAPPATTHHVQSIANSVEYSEQGRYEYSALGSLANSPAQSHMPDEAVRSARTGTATAASTALDVSPRSRQMPQPNHHQQHPHSNTGTSKQLPAQTSVVSRARGVDSESSSSSSDSEDDDDVARTPVVSTPASAARPFGAGVVLGARRPISTHSPRSTTAVGALPTMGRTTTAAAAATSAQGTNLLATLRSMPSTDSDSSNTSDSDGTTTSSSAAAVAAAIFHRQQQARRAVKEDHRESSFHNYSEAASSPPGSLATGHSPQRQHRRHDPGPASASQDTFSNTVHSGHRSAHGSPLQRPKDRPDASVELSRALSHSVSRPQTAHSESLAASSVGRRGSLASGGYYYGYDFGMGSPSQQSVASNGAAEHGTPSSSPGYDY